MDKIKELENLLLLRFADEPMGNYRYCLFGNQLAHNNIKENLLVCRGFNNITGEEGNIIPLGSKVELDVCVNLESPKEEDFEYQNLYEGTVVAHDISHESFDIIGLTQFTPIFIRLEHYDDGLTEPDEDFSDLELMERLKEKGAI